MYTAICQYLKGPLDAIVNMFGPTNHKWGECRVESLRGEIASYSQKVDLLNQQITILSSLFTEFRGQYNDLQNRLKALE